MSFRTGRKTPHPDAPKPLRVIRPLTLTAAQAKLIRGARKTTHRLPAITDPRRTHRPDDTLTVQAAGDIICHILITSVRTEPLGHLEFKDARTEGFRTRDEFFAHWRTTHQLGLPARYRDLLERLVDAPASLPRHHIHPGLPNATLSRRLADLHRQGLAAQETDGTWEITEAGAELLTDTMDGIDLTQQVTVLEFKLDDRDVPAFLAPTARPSGSVNGYVTNSALAMDKTEVMHVHELHADWRQRSEQLRQTAAAQHAGERQEKVLLKQLRDEIRANRNQGIDLTDDLVTIAGQLQRMRQRREQRAA